jgi:tripartite-type tricarboxylate transporter receptor subunit TctC
MVAHAYRIGRLSRLSALCLVAGLALVAGSFSASAQTDKVAANFQGKTVRLIVGFGAGGGHDIMARVLAQYWPKAIPGNPRMVVENMPGGLSKVAAEMVSTERPSGLVLGVVVDVFYTHALGQKFASFDGSKARIVGRAHAPVYDFSAVRADVAKSFADLRKLDKPAAIGGLGHVVEGGWSYFIEAYKLPLKVVPGYAGTVKMLQAFESKEIQVVGMFRQGTVERTFPGLIKSSEVALVLDPFCTVVPDQAALLKAGGWTRPPCWHDVLPLTNAEKAAVKAYTDINGTSTYKIMTPPGIDEAVLKALRDSLRTVMTDPEVLGVMTQRELEPGYSDGAEVEELVRQVRELPDDVKTIVKKMRGV